MNETWNLNLKNDTYCIQFNNNNIINLSIDFKWSVLLTLMLLFIIVRKRIAAICFAKKKKSTYLYLRLFQAQVRQLVGQVFAIKGSSRVFLVVVTMTLLMAL